MFKYTLTNGRRSDCPHCGKRGKYSAYMNVLTGELAPIEYGMCSSCREYVMPPDNIVTEEASQEVDTVIGYFEADTLSANWIESYYKPTSHVQNNFIEALERIFGEERVKRVVDLFKLGRFHDSGIVFPYLLTDNHVCTAKIMFYDRDLHRIKEGNKQHPKWLHNLFYRTDRGFVLDFRDYETDDNGNDIVKKFKLKLCLFGHNQIINDKCKGICLVESEKTAVIMSIVFPEYIWVASGGRSLIQDYKFIFFGKRKCYVFPDMSSDDNVYDYWYKKLSMYNRKFGYDFQFVDYYTEFLHDDKNMIQFCKDKQFDIADFMINFNKENCYLDFLKTQICVKEKVFHVFAK